MSFQFPTFGRGAGITAVAAMAMALAVFLAVILGVVWVPTKDPAGVVTGGLVSRVAFAALYLVLVSLVGLVTVARYHWSRALPVFFVCVITAMLCFLSVPGAYFGSALMDHNCRAGTASSEIICENGVGISVYRDTGLPNLLRFHAEASYR